MEMLRRLVRGIREKNKGKGDKEEGWEGKTNQYWGRDRKSCRGLKDSPKRKDSHGG